MTKTTIEPEILHEMVEEYCDEWTGEADHVYFHDMIDGKAVKISSMWDCFIEWAEDRPVYCGCGGFPASNNGVCNDCK